MTAQDKPAETTLARKIDALFRTPGHEYTYAEVAEGIRRLHGPTIATTQLWELRHGVKTNPRIGHLEALARFFSVPVRYFFPDDDLGANLYVRLNLVHAMSDNQIERIALRASGLSSKSLHAIAEIIEQARLIEGLADVEPPRLDSEGTDRVAMHGLKETDA